MEEHMKERSGYKWLMYGVVAIFLLLPCGKSFGDTTGKIIIFNAGSLTIPFAKMEKVFESRYPKVDIM
jgi:molybdate/tungstate transport system substrate-binding protein